MKTHDLGPEPKTETSSYKAGINARSSGGEVQNWAYPLHRFKATLNNVLLVSLDSFRLFIDSLLYIINIYIYIYIYTPATPKSHKKRVPTHNLVFKGKAWFSKSIFAGFVWFVYRFQEAKPASSTENLVFDE